MFLEGLAEVSVEFDLQQAIGEGPPVALSLQQATREIPFVGCSFAARYCGRAISVPSV